MSDGDNAAGCGCGCLVVVVLGVGAWAWYAYHQKGVLEEQALLRVVDLAEQRSTEFAANSPATVETFWPGETRVSADGYLMSDKFIPLRALARLPNAALFKSEELKFPADVVGTIKPWQPYYVFQRSNGALQVGAQPRTPAAERRWVKEGECFCWTTRECINIESPVKIYPTRESAENDESPREDAYTYPYAAHFESGIDGRDEQNFRITSLPVLTREDGKYWCFVRPEGTDQGYQVCWINWDGSHPAVNCRIRTGRREFEEYMSGVRQLMVDYRTPEKKTGAIEQLYNHGLADMARAEKLGPNALNEINARREGIPKLTGYLENPIDSPFQYEQVSQRVIKLLELSEEDIWDVNEVAYVSADKLP